MGGVSNSQSKYGSRWSALDLCKWGYKFNPFWKSTEEKASVYESLSNFCFHLGWTKWQAESQGKSKSGNTEVLTKNDGLFWLFFVLFFDFRFCGIVFVILLCGFDPWTYFTDDNHITCQEVRHVCLRLTLRSYLLIPRARIMYLTMYLTWLDHSVCFGQSLGPHTCWLNALTMSYIPQELTILKNNGSLAFPAKKKVTKRSRPSWRTVDSQYILRQSSTDRNWNINEAVISERPHLWYIPTTGPQSLPASAMSI